LLKEFLLNVQLNVQTRSMSEGFATFCLQSNWGEMKKLLTIMILATLLPVGFSQPATASSEVRIKTDAITVWVPKVIKAPKSGCSEVPVRYRWGNYYSSTTSAEVTLYDKKDYIVGDVQFFANTSEPRGTVLIKICAERWLDEDGIPTFPVKRGLAAIDLWVLDDGNHRGWISEAAAKVRIR